jgi:hypothetical protein
MKDVAKSGIIILAMKICQTPCSVLCMFTSFKIEFHPSSTIGLVRELWIILKLGSKLELWINCTDRLFPRSSHRTLIVLDTSKQFHQLGASQVELPKFKEKRQNRYDINT